MITLKATTVALALVTVLLLGAAIDMSCNLGIKIRHRLFGIKKVMTVIEILLVVYLVSISIFGKRETIDTSTTTYNIKALTTSDITATNSSGEINIKVTDSNNVFVVDDTNEKLHTLEKTKEDCILYGKLINVTYDEIKYTIYISSSDEANLSGIIYKAE
jgi:hypothetical protein